MTKVTTGRAGAVRIQPLKLNDLAQAEDHGKRLDESSKARAIYPNAPPLTTTGLDLKQQYREHVNGVFIPKNNTKALHVIIQFPTELVDGEDAKYMLKHARGLAEKIFGKRAIFADRVDRDEQGRHNVDLFLVPIYKKKTKHTLKDAVGLSVHTKKLATQYYPEETRTKPDGKIREINVYDIGRALQDALFDYLREDMGLEQVLRGSPKLAPGPDWKAAEELRLQELKDLKEKAEAEAKLAERSRIDAEAAKSVAVECAKEAEAERARQQRATEEQQAATQAAEHDRTVAHAERTRADDARFHAGAERARAERLRLEAEVGSRLAADEARRTRETATRLLVQAQQDLAQADKEKREIDKRRVVLDQEREALALARQQDALRLNLLERAMDDSNNLNLRPTPDWVSMDDRYMSAPERQVYQSKWPKALFEIARRLAAALEKVRHMLKIAKDQSEAIARRHQELNNAEANFQQREALLTNAERALQTSALSAAEQVALARRELNRAHEAQQANAEWSTILTHVGDGRMNFAEDGAGKWKFLPGDCEAVAPWVESRLRTAPPPWVENCLTFMKALDAAAAIAERDQIQAAAHTAALKSVVERADKAFTPAQKGAVVAAKVALAQGGAHQGAFRAAQEGPGRN